MKRTATCIAFLATLLSIGAPLCAAGQSTPTAVQESPNKDELQQRDADMPSAQANAAQIGAAPKFSWVNAGTAAGSMSSHQGGYVQAVLMRGDALDGTDALTCTQNNGARIRLSGGFRPSHESSVSCK